MKRKRCLTTMQLADIPGHPQDNPGHLAMTTRFRLAGKGKGDNVFADFAERTPMNPDIWTLAALLVAFSVVWFVYHAGNYLRYVCEREEAENNPPRE